MATESRAGTGEPAAVFVYKTYALYFSKYRCSVPANMKSWRPVVERAELQRLKNWEKKMNQLCLLVHLRGCACEGQGCTGKGKSCCSSYYSFCSRKGMATRASSSCPRVESTAPAAPAGAAAAAAAEDTEDDEPSGLSADLLAVSSLRRGVKLKGMCRSFRCPVWSLIQKRCTYSI